jgi:hypothetical protein
VSDRDQALTVGIAREAGGACAAAPGAPGAPGRLCEAAQQPVQGDHPDATPAGRGRA